MLLQRKAGNTTGLEYAGRDSQLYFYVGRLHERNGAAFTGFASFGPLVERDEPGIMVLPTCTPFCRSGAPVTEPPADTMSSYIPAPVEDLVGPPDLGS